MAIEIAAPAKVNLTLHVTGRRADGYHLLDSLVVFADAGDRITVAPAERLRLRITGPQAGALTAGEDNLVLRAARTFGETRGAALVLDKRLPVAAGLGGGSSDAAATLRALARLWSLPLPDDDAVLALGADLPACLAAAPLRMTGAGEGIAPLPALPPAWLVLANPGLPLSTPQVFAALECRENAAMPDRLPGFVDAADVAAFLQQMRNDLEEPAIRLMPEIGLVRAALGAQPGCLLARMSGSGASCFGLFANGPAAEAAETALRAARPGWWVQAAALREGAPVS